MVAVVNRWVVGMVDGDASGGDLRHHIRGSCEWKTEIFVNKPNKNKTDGKGKLMY